MSTARLCCCTEAIICPDWFDCSPYPQTITYPRIVFERRWWEVHDGTNLVYEYFIQLTFRNIKFAVTSENCATVIPPDPEGDPTAQPFASMQASVTAYTYPKLAYYGDWDPVLFCLGNCPPCKLLKPCSKVEYEEDSPLTVTGSICCADPCNPTASPANQSPLNRMDLTWQGDVHRVTQSGTQLTNGSCECPPCTDPFSCDIVTQLTGTIRFWGKNGCLNTDTFKCRIVDPEPAGYVQNIDVPDKLTDLPGATICQGQYESFQCIPINEVLFRTQLGCSEVPWGVIATHADVKTCAVNACVDPHTCWVNLFGGPDNNGDGCADNAVSACGCQATGSVCALNNNTNGVASIVYNDQIYSVFDPPSIP